MLMMQNISNYKKKPENYTKLQMDLVNFDKY